jgi:hypothetical protein
MGSALREATNPLSAAPEIPSNIFGQFSTGPFFLTPQQFFEVSADQSYEPPERPSKQLVSSSLLMSSQ